MLGEEEGGGSTDSSGILSIERTESYLHGCDDRWVCGGSRLTFFEVSEKGRDEASRKEVEEVKYMQIG